MLFIVRRYFKSFINSGIFWSEELFQTFVICNKKLPARLPMINLERSYVSWLALQSTTQWSFMWQKMVQNNFWVVWNTLIGQSKYTCKAVLSAINVIFILLCSNTIILYKAFLLFFHGLMLPFCRPISNPNSSNPTQPALLTRRKPADGGGQDYENSLLLKPLT